MTTEKSKTTVVKIRKAATKLFGKFGFYNVSIKQIAEESGTNSALISYYYGGKKQLYAAVIAQQSDLIGKLQNKIKKENAPALAGLYAYLEAIMKAQMNKDENIGLLYREVLTPTGLCDVSISEHLRALHGFTIELINRAVTEKALKPLSDESSAAFILESITVLIFLVRKPLAESFNAKTADYNAALKNLIASYLDPYLVK